MPIAACFRRSVPVAMKTKAEMDDYLQPTSYIDTDHSAIIAVVDDVTREATTMRQSALALFEFVRAIPFGFAAGFWDNKASDVLRAGRGYCNTKSTLFVALLRAAGVPARQQFVEIDSAVLFGILDPGTAMVDHSYVEVLLDGQWIATDAYIVDPALFAAAQRRLAADNRLLGYSAHATGSNEWDGVSPSFSQYNMLDPRPIGSKRWGVFADVGDFYARVGDTHNRLNAFMRAGVGLITAPANRRADVLRREG
jgi:transglutaminase-like putative cysteine protease